METEELKFIHLLYVPTMNCNMQCKYCYLKEDTVDSGSEKKCVETLDYAVKKFKAAGVVPFHISLHGGEVTCLSKEDFRDVVSYISKYYYDNGKMLSRNGFKVGMPHIKTNLYGLDRHIDTIKEYRVSVSGSLDLPFSLHKEYRITKDGRQTLTKILQNVALLQDLPNRKKVSATIFKEHYDRIDEMIEDIRYLSRNTCLDMNDFNFMIGFAGENDLLTPLNEEEQVDFYNRMHKAFDDTDLDEGVNHAWFAEFTPDYCTNCDNCGEKFFLLERNGDIYSCVRGQGHKEFYYGNIFRDEVHSILARGADQIFLAHGKKKLNRECVECSYIGYCKTGCPFVKNFYDIDKSYTCKLQKKIYMDNPADYPLPEQPEEVLYNYASKMHPLEAKEFYPKNTRNIDLSMPTLREIIEKDEKLTNIYSPDIFTLKVDQEEYHLESQILKIDRDILYINRETDIKLYVKKEVFDDVCEYPASNTLYIMLLSGDTIVYGDEGREKQAHIMTHQVFRNILASYPSDREDCYCFDLSKLLAMYRETMSKDKPNNLFFTTSALRDYHYVKHKNNAYYHIQAVNLPFQNIEFYYLL
ncbi:MAG: radical SAM protein [Lachnospiraceae bacterium]